MKNRYFIVNKPYGMLSQFISEKEGTLLGDLSFDFPPGTHAVGRLDKHSEGLLLLTTNKKVTRLLFQGDILHKRTYLVQVKKIVTEETLQHLRNGVSIRVIGGEQYITSACGAEIVEEPTGLFKSGNNNPVYPPYTWLLITLTEGRFRQIRKMVRAVHHHCLRLIRVSIEEILLDDLQPGHVREVEEEDFFRLLHINYNSVIQE